MRHLSPGIESIRTLVRTSEPAPRASGIETGELVEHARRLIARHGQRFLLIERTVRATGVSIRIDAVAADGTRTNGIACSGDRVMRPLCYAANAVLRRLAEEHCAAERIGLMTDGIGMVFSPDRLAVRDPDWLGAVLTGDARGVTLAPFSPTGHWARLSALHPCAEPQ